MEDTAARVDREPQQMFGKAARTSAGIDGADVFDPGTHVAKLRSIMKRKKKARLSPGLHQRTSYDSTEFGTARANIVHHIGFDSVLGKPSTTRVAIHTEIPP